VLNRVFRAGFEWVGFSREVARFALRGKLWYSKSASGDGLAWVTIAYLSPVLLRRYGAGTSAVPCFIQSPRRNVGCGVHCADP